MLQFAATTFPIFMHVIKETRPQSRLKMAALFEGTLPPKQLKMVQAWIEIHKEELMVDWELAVNGEDPFRIAPLQ